MDWDSIGLESDVLHWLDETGKRTATRERRLDPFATSMRDFDDVAANLDRVQRKLAIEHTDPTQRIADLRSASLVETTTGAVRLTGYGKAVIDSWRKHGVANADKLDETARTLIAYGVGRQLAASPYVDFFAYWTELRAVFEAENLIDSWDALFTLNYLDHRIDGFAPGDAIRDEVISVDRIDFDLDEFAIAVSASPRAIKGSKQVARGIQGKVPRGRARATACLSMELLLQAAADRPGLIARFGLPIRPRQWEPLDAARRSRLLQIAASFDTAATVPASALAKPASVALGRVMGEIDFASVLKPPPRPIKAKVGRKGSGPKKTDYKRQQERNSEVGSMCEQFAVKFEQWRLRAQPKLAAKVERVSLDDDTLGFDIRSFETDGSDRLVEVKGTEGPLSTRFFMSINELACAQANTASYVLLRVGNMRVGPTCCEIRPPFKELELTPAVYECRFKPREDKEKPD